MGWKNPLESATTPGEERTMASLSPEAGLSVGSFINVCVARLPQCWRCAVRAYCDYEPKTPPP